MTEDITDLEVDRSRCARATWPEEALLDHYESHVRRDPRIRSVTAYERMARGTCPFYWEVHDYG